MMKKTGGAKPMQSGTPIPKLENEMKAVGSGPVITYKLSPEELEKYGPVKPYTDPEKKPVAIKDNFSSEQQSRRAKMRKDKYPHVTKELVLAELEKGKSIAQIEREQGMKVNTLAARLRKWGIKGQKSQASEERAPTQLLETDRAKIDLVNAPPHYTVGGIETIDFIQAKLTPEQFIGY